MLERFERVGNLEVDRHQDSCKGLRSATVRRLRLRTVPSVAAKVLRVVTKMQGPERVCFGVTASRVVSRTSSVPAVTG